jgi:uncharacterized membrane protein
LRALHALSVAALLALIFLCLAWELWLAPLRTGGSWLALKALPLLAPLFGILHGRAYTFRWAPMLAIGYFVEGVVRAYADVGMSSTLARAEIAAALLFFASAIGYLRASEAQQQTRASHAMPRANGGTARRAGSRRARR